jgi:hypothetical protein
VPKVHFYDVEHIGHQLRLNLHQAKIPFADINDYLEIDSEKITIVELKELLSK